MNNLQHMVEQQILHYEANLKHMDEVFERAKASSQKEVMQSVEELSRMRDEMADYLEHMRIKSLDDWRQEEIEKAGPMGIWDAVAQQLEGLVERLEH